MLMLDLIVYKITILFCIDKSTLVNVSNSLFFFKNLESVKHILYKAILFRF